MNIFNIRKTFQQKKERGWDRIYFAIDLHDTVIEGKYTKFNEGAQIFPYAREFFAWAAKREDVYLVLWTSSWNDAIQKTLPWLESEGIRFDAINENPDCKSTTLCDFGKKFYFNVLLDDKAGFEGNTDWKLLIDELKSIGEWNEVDPANTTVSLST